GVVCVLNGPAPGQADGSELAVEVEAVEKRPLQGGHAGRAAQVVVLVVEPRVDGAIRGVVDQMQELAGGSVLVSRKRAVAFVHARETPARVIGIRHDQAAPVVGQAGQPAGVVIGVVHGEARLIDHTRPAAAGVVGVIEGSSIGVGNPRKVVGAVVFV